MIFCASLFCQRGSLPCHVIVSYSDKRTDERIDGRMYIVLLFFRSFKSTYRLLRPLLWIWIIVVFSSHDQDTPSVSLSVSVCVVRRRKPLNRLLFFGLFLFSTDAGQKSILEYLYRFLLTGILVSMWDWDYRSVGIQLKSNFVASSRFMCLWGFVCFVYNQPCSLDRSFIYHCGALSTYAKLVNCLTGSAISTTSITVF